MRRRFWERWAVVAVLLLPVRLLPAELNPWADSIPAPEIEVPFPTITPDPFQPANRGLGAINDWFVDWVVLPTSHVYRFAVRKPLRDALKNAAHNLEYPGRLANNLLQGKWRGAGEETKRFLLNSTLGIAGLLDVATRHGVGRSDEDFGQTFGYWGWRPHVFYMFPVQGPSNDRDAIGAIGGVAFNPASYLFPLSPILAYNRLADGVHDYRDFAAAHSDHYTMIRDMWSLQREAAIREPGSSAKETPARTAAIETLGAPLFSPREESFRQKGREGRVRVGATGKRLPYTVWKQKGPAPLVCFLPGLGGHRLSESAMAMAEIAFNAGNSVVSISSTFNYEFIARGLSSPVPGYPDADVRDVYGALDAIYRELVETGGMEVLETKLVGVSMGAFQTLYLAARPGLQSGALRFQRYVAVHPPVNLVHAVQQLDAYYNAPLAWTKDSSPEMNAREPMSRSELVAALEAVLVKAARIAEGDAPSESAIPLSDIEAQYLVGAAFRLTLRDAIYASQQREYLGVLRRPLRPWNRNKVYGEILEYCFAEYLNAFLLPYYAARWEQGDLLSAFMASSDLKTMDEQLAGKEHIYLVTSENDFVLAPGDLEWLRQIIPPERASVLPAGGHLGGLYRPEVRDVIASRIGSGPKLVDEEIAAVNRGRPAGSRGAGSDLFHLSQPGTRQ